MTLPLTDKTGTPVEVRLTPEGNAYGIYLEGEQHWAGATYFLDNPHSAEGIDRIFFHTIVGEEYAGRGLASILVEQALTDTEKHGHTVIPVCPFVRSWTAKNQWSGALRQPSKDDIAFITKNTRGE